MEEVTRRDKGRRLGEREERKRVIMALILTVEMICRHFPLSLTTRQCQGVFVRLCVSTSVCVGSQTGIPSLNVDDSFMWFGTSEHYQSVCWETLTHSLFLSHSQTQTHRHKRSIHQYQQSGYDFTIDGKQRCQLSGILFHL